MPSRLRRLASARAREEALDRRRGRDPGLVHVRLVVRDDVLRPVAIVDHDARALADAFLGEIGAGQHTLDRGAVAEVEARDGTGAVAVVPSPEQISSSDAA